MEMTSTEFIVTKLKERDPNINESDIKKRLSKLDKESTLKLVEAVYAFAVLGVGRKPTI